MRVKETDFGIIPIPKHDESQEYITPAFIDSTVLNKSASFATVYDSIEAAVQTGVE